ncbi:MAG: DegT/DnrJ/EryC1/StrS family aminotransferase [Planctomycetaceae bacterium]|nr:DegT/DnrJ/EryC1/StrS family aminotransferase [Planctomycetaceae bacterium]
MSRNVPFFNYQKFYTQNEAELMPLIQDVCRRGAFILQKDLQQFEENLAKYLGAKYVIGMANATDALHFLVRAAGIGAGDEVIFCSHTMVASPASIYFAGATPVPVECGADHLIDPTKIEAAITPRTNTIMPTQLNGRTANMEAIQEIADKYGLMILEDSAQALGSKFDGKCAGTFGKGMCISFYPAKTLGCFGDGGCLITNDDEIYETIMLLRDHGRNHDGEVVMWGLNSRLDNLQAAILDYKLKTYEQDIERRRDIARMYESRLGTVPGMTLPPGPDSDPRHFDIFQNYEIECDNRDGLRQHLRDNNIGTLVQWGGKAVHQFPKLKLNRSLPFTEKMFTRCIMLPMNTMLDDEDIHYVCDCVEQFYATGVKSRAA